MSGSSRMKGFTLVELLFVMAIVGLLLGITIPGVRMALYHADKTKSVSNIRQLAVANNLYAAEHGHYAPWGNLQNNVRWHSARTANGFDARGGYLSPYLAEEGEVLRCPVFDKWDSSPGGESFDEGAGGYGYNAAYLGGRPSLLGRSAPAGGSRGSYVPWWTVGNPVNQVPRASEVVMFASTAIARGGGLVETDEAAPYRSLTPGGLGQRMTPTVHFRFKGDALVAWADGRVSLEPPNEEVANDWSVYGENNEEYRLGWFGPMEWNGYWNPRFRDRRAY